MVELNINNRIFKLSKGDDLFVSDTKNELYVPSSCKKQGLCKECLIIIEEGGELLNNATEEEKHLKNPYRLACQAKIISDSGYIKCSTLKKEKINIEEFGLNENYNFVKGLFDPPILKNNANHVELDSKTVSVIDTEILGLAVDIGTTTIVLWLIDISNGEILSVYSFENPQRFAGSNVMSRIEYDNNDDSNKLQKVIIEYINTAIKKMTPQYKSIYILAIGGNTTMRDLAFGINVSTIGKYPYVSVTENEYKSKLRNSTSLISTARRLKIPIHPKSKIYSLPLIGNHIGADIAAGLLATEFFRSKGNIVFIDIGTNTEIVVKKGEKYFAASSPSGPAFEGGGICYGMPALNGAIADFRITNDEIKYDVIGDKEPIGICGSGLISILSELRKNDIIDELGRFDDDIIDDDKYYLNHEKTVYISENDINQLIQAKSANASALRILLHRAELELKNIDKYFIAGGFGKHISIPDSINIGLLPADNPEKFMKVGNVAVEGLAMTLIDKSLKAFIESEVSKIEVISLEKEENFFDYFVDSCRIEPFTN